MRKETAGKVSRLMALAISGLLLLSACGGGTRPATGTGDTKQEAAAPGKTYDIKLSISVSLTDAAGKAATELAKNVKEKSKGRINLKVFPNEQLGGEPVVMQGIKSGIIQMAFVSPGAIGNVYVDFQAFNGPFLFPDWEVAKKVLIGPVGQGISEGLRKSTGIRVVDPLWYWGWRDMTASRPIRKPDDLKGLKMRAPNIPIFVAMFKALGSNPTTVDFNEIYAALQQGVIDGEENPIPAIWSKKFYEVNKVVSATHHILQSNVIIMNDEYFNSLPKDLQDLLVTEVEKSGEINTKLQMEMEQSLRDQMKTKGITFVDDVDREAFRKMTENVYDQFKDKWSPNLYQKLRDASGAR